MTRLYANNFSTTLDGAITDVATTITLTSVTDFPAVGSGDTCQLTIDDGSNIEIVQVTAISGNDLTVVRGQEGTSGTAFADLDTVEIRLTKEAFEDVLGADETPTLAGPLDLDGNYVSFGGSSSATAYSLVSVGGVPELKGAANYKYTFTSNSLVMNAGTSWYSLTMANSAGFTCTTNNVVRIQANNSGVQFGAAGARINSVLDEDDMVSDSATDLCTQQSIKAYVDASGGGGISNLVDDTTPQLGGELELNGNYIDFGVSSTSSAYNINSTGGVPVLQGPANYRYTFSGSALYMQAGTSWNSLTWTNTSDRLKIKTNNQDRLQVNDNGIIVTNGSVKLESYTVAGVPSASTHGAGAMIYVSDETGGATMAFSDGTNWKRCSDLATVS